jgi:hypothetical protein
MTITKWFHVFNVSRYLQLIILVKSEHNPHGKTYSAAVKIWVELTQMALIGLS